MTQLTKTAREDARYRCHTSLTATLIFPIPIELGGGEWIWEERDYRQSTCDDCVENPVTDLC